MESQPQNPEFRNDPENFHPCLYEVIWLLPANDILLCADNLCKKLDLMIRTDVGWDTLQISGWY